LEFVVSALYLFGLDVGSTTTDIIPIVAGLALNILVLAGIVYPLSARARSTEARAASAAQQLQSAEREDADARGIAERRDRTDRALKAFYKDVLPSNHAQARQATFLRLTQLAEQHNLEPARRSTDPRQEQDSSLARVQISMTLQGDYQDIRRFIYQVESGGDVIVIDSISLQQGVETNSPLTLALALSTYYRPEPDAP
jgi:Tfp pilus assembly protein PilO